MKARYERYLETDPIKAHEYLLNDIHDASHYVSAQGYSDNVMNVAMPSTYRFMKKVNLSWAGVVLVFGLLLWCTAVTPGKVADPATYTCAVYSTFFSLLPPVIAIVLALNTKEVYTSLLVGIASGALLYANGNLELALNTLFFNEDGGMITKLSDSGNVGILAFLVMLGILVALMNKAGGSAAFGRWGYLLLGVAAAALCLTLAFAGRYGAALLPLLYLTLHVATWRKMVRIDHGDALNVCLGETARNIMLFGALLTVGILIG